MHRPSPDPAHTAATADSRQHTHSPAGDVDAVTRAAALIPAGPPQDVPHARAAIDGIDAALAVLLERRARIAADVQRMKPVGFQAGRDGGREERIVAAMAERAPRLGAERLARIMAAVIETGLDAAQHEQYEYRSAAAVGVAVSYAR